MYSSRQHCRLTISRDVAAGSGGQNELPYDDANAYDAYEATWLQTTEAAGCGGEAAGKYAKRLRPFGAASNMFIRRRWRLSPPADCRTRHRHPTYGSVTHWLPVTSASLIDIGKHRLSASYCCLRAFIRRNEGKCVKRNAAKSSIPLRRSKTYVSLAGCRENRREQ
jgi:hypothetical protein